ncbi:MAG: hypothetical protein NVV60_13485 [Luteimonas sp.]|nr:hypothetical protein [Luteimonas sp.]
MTLARARLLVVLIGLVLPYAVRLPFGLDWLAQYTHVGLPGWLLLGGCNAIAWGAILLVSLAYRHAASLLVPALCGFAFLAWAHAGLDLQADAQSPIALVFIPIYALAPILLGGVVGYVVDRVLRQRPGA